MWVHGGLKWANRLFLVQKVYHYFAALNVLEATASADASSVVCLLSCLFQRCVCRHGGNGVPATVLVLREDLPLQHGAEPTPLRQGWLHEARGEWRF